MSIAELEPVAVVDLVGEEVHLDSDTAILELVNGVRVEKKVGARQMEVASILLQILGAFAKNNRLGKVTMEMPFVIDAVRRTWRKPDVSFVSARRWPIGKAVPYRAVWDIVPELAVEVISPSEFAEDSLTKVRDYFKAGVENVWLIYPSLKVIHVFESFTSIRVLTEDDILDGGAIVPGFSLSLKELFEGEEDETETVPQA